MHKITYELAKQLKDAGFPQEGKGYVEFDPATRRAITNRYLTQEYYFPTLSELIEACGKRFVCLWRYPDHYDVLDPLTGSGYSGPTAEEAVARLYLAVNKK